VTGGLGNYAGISPLISHRSFQTPKWLEYFLVLRDARPRRPVSGLECTAYIICTRIKKLTPYSNQGFWWSHWFYHAPAESKFLASLKTLQTVYQFVQNYFVLLQVALVLLFLLGGWSFVVWIFVRLVVVLPLRTSIVQPISLAIAPMNLVISQLLVGALLVYGEGWHNNHHAFQYSARHGMQWWEIDLTWMTIQLLQALGLASNVKLVGKDSEVGRS